MSYQLSLEGHLGGDLRRLVAAQIERAIAQLEHGPDGDFTLAIHQARKHFKKIRALLRLARGALRGGTFRQENACFRNAGRALGGLRDAQVLVASLDALRKHATAPSPSYAPLRRHLVQLEKRSILPEKSSRIVAATLLELRAARRRVKCWKLDHFRWKDARASFERSYRQARRAFRAAAQDASVETLHEWRKRTKDLWYQARLLRGASPDVMAELADELRTLAEWLGQDHDLALLHEALETFTASGHKLPQLALLQTQIGVRREELQSSALLLADSLFASRPHAFTRHLAAARKVHRKQCDAAQPEITGPAE